MASIMHRHISQFIFHTESALKRSFWTVNYRPYLEERNTFSGDMYLTFIFRIQARL